VQVRFIEFMPLDASGAWRATDVVGQDEIVSAIDAVYPLEPVPGRGAAPADRWRYVDGAGEVGVIPSVTKPFCGDCDRVRLTAEGQFRTCLFETREFDLRAIVRRGGTDDEIAAEIERAVGTKWAGHAIGRVTFVRPPRSMSQIGG
jgi:cyclic pyranopterin phosphate synthase